MLNGSEVSLNKFSRESCTLADDTFSREEESLILRNLLVEKIVTLRKKSWSSRLRKYDLPCLSFCGFSVHAVSSDTFKYAATADFATEL